MIIFALGWRCWLYSCQHLWHLLTSRHFCGTPGGSVWSVPAVRTKILHLRVSGPTQEWWMVWAVSILFMIPFWNFDYPYILYLRFDVRNSPLLLCTFNIFFFFFFCLDCLWVMVYTSWCVCCYKSLLLRWVKFSWMSPSSHKTSLDRWGILPIKPTWITSFFTT